MAYNFVINSCGVQYVLLFGEVFGGSNTNQMI